MIMEFELTEQHLKLLRHLHVEWRHNPYFGVPSINNKRPYGNSDVLTDIGELMGFTPEPEKYNQGFPENILTFLLKLHGETRTALQIVLCTGSFEPGRYRMRDFSDVLSWYNTITTPPTPIDKID